MMRPLEFTATAKTSPRFMSAEYFKGLGTESNGIVGTFAFATGGCGWADSRVPGWMGTTVAAATSAARTMSSFFTGPPPQIGKALSQEPAHLKRFCAARVDASCVDSERRQMYLAVGFGGFQRSAQKQVELGHVIVGLVVGLVLAAAGPSSAEE